LIKMIFQFLIFIINKFFHNVFGFSIQNLISFFFNLPRGEILSEDEGKLLSFVS